MAFFSTSIHGGLLHDEHDEHDEHVCTTHDNNLPQLWHSACGAIPGIRRSHTQLGTHFTVPSCGWHGAKAYLQRQVGCCCCGHKHHNSRWGAGYFQLMPQNPHCVVGPSNHTLMLQTHKAFQCNFPQLNPWSEHNMASYQSMHA